MHTMKPTIDLASCLKPTNHDLNFFNWSIDLSISRNDEAEPLRPSAWLTPKLYGCFWSKWPQISPYWEDGELCKLGALYSISNHKILYVTSMCTCGPIIENLVVSCGPQMQSSQNPVQEPLCQRIQNLPLFYSPILLGQLEIFLPQC
jgi:hypothetical protein